MVHRIKDLANPPVGLIDIKWNALKATLLSEMNNHKAKVECYRDTTLDSLTKLYANKCAICERNRGAELEVDHYRPKKERNNSTDTQYNQPGYYWLCYEWSNLLPLCSKCNGSKSNKFPLMVWTETNRISTHLNIHGVVDYKPYDFAWLNAKEQPFLINPEQELTPERHFMFHKNGKMNGRTFEGVETINICKLNRKDLKRERAKIKYEYITAIQSALNDYSIYGNKCELKGELKGIFKRIKLNCHVDSDHSLYHVYLYKYFDYFIGSSFPADLRNLINKYFNDVNI